MRFYLICLLLLTAFGSIAISNAKESQHPAKNADSLIESNLP